MINSMKDRRTKLHNLLVTILGSNHVYYQPPENVKMVYPAIVYSRSSINNTFAEDNIYKQSVAYHITVIDKDPDSRIVDNISKLPTCRFLTHYVKDNLNHDSFEIYI